VADMSNELVKNMKVYLTENKTIVDLSQLIQKYDSEIYLKKIVNGSVIEVNLKSFLGLINLQLLNGDEIEARAEGEDSQEALLEVERFFSKN
jgi:phosphocarrier protein HPr